MKVLITGGTGFLGGRLARYLDDTEDIQITIATRKSIEVLDWLPQATVFKINWENLNDLSAVCTDTDVIIHAAGMNAEDCTADPVKALEFNGLVTAKLLHEAIKKKVPKFVFVSTAHVYMNPLVHAITEETCPINLHPYAYSNRAGEDIVRAASQAGYIDGIVVRVSNSFGPPAHRDADCWQLFVNDLCRQVVTTGKMVLKTSGMQRRDFVAITDVCRAIAHIIRFPGKTYDIFNVGGEWSPTLLEMACLIHKRISLLQNAFEYTIVRGKNISDKAAVQLDYSVNRLKKTGFEFKKQVHEEIDDLLKFCQKNFK